MSQHDMNVANMGFPALRSDMNSALAALASNNSGATEPDTKFPYMWWPDTANDMMKQRNAGNSAWIGVFSLSTGVPLAGTGKVLQVVSKLVATQGSQTITSADSIVGSLTKTITPKGDDSSFLVTVRWVGEVSGAWDVPFNIHMDSVRVNIDGQGRGYGLAMPSQSHDGGINNDSTPETVNFSTLVTTSSVIGTSITFSLVADADSSKTLWNNRSFNITGSSYERGTSEIIITEIGA